MDSSHSAMNHQSTIDLLSNIEEYKNQLDAVNQALESASESDKTQLQDLQLNLISILELTLNQLDQIQEETKTLQKEIAKKDENINSNIDEEFERFKSEIAELDGTKEQEHEDDLSSEDEEITKKVKELTKSLKEMEGQSIRVPFKERWGGFSYHNAIVLSLVPHEDQPVNIENPEILALFSQPTSLSMLPCRFFLDGRCKFTEEDCKFSHGAKVSFSDVKEYLEPDKDGIVSGTKVLSLHEGQDIWHPGAVEDVLEDRAGFSFNCTTCNKVFETSLESMVPLYAHDDDDDDSPEKPDEPFASTRTPDLAQEPEKLFIPNDLWLKNSLSTKLGDWEKYTKGIGSKLMAQMGYITGTGLGPKGEGKVDPVTAYVYPQGVSLDHCMHLRQSSNGGCMLEVEKRLLAQQKKQEAKAKRQSQHLMANTSVFDIINNKLGFKQSKASPDLKGGPKNALDVSFPALKNDSTRELNRKNFQLSSRIEKLNEEMRTLEKTRSRQGKDPVTLKAIDRSLKEKMLQLSSLQKAEQQIQKEQTSRKNRQNFCSF